MKPVANVVPLGGSTLSAARRRVVDQWSLSTSPRRRAAALVRSLRSATMVSATIANTSARPRSTRSVMSMKQFFPHDNAGGSLAKAPRRWTASLMIPLAVFLAIGFAWAADTPTLDDLAAAIDKLQNGPEGERVVLGHITRK